MPVLILFVAFLALAIGSMHWSLGVATCALAAGIYYIHTHTELISWLKGYILWAKYMTRQEFHDTYPIRKLK